MRLPNPPSVANLSTSVLGAKLAASLALVGAAASIAGLGTYATFTSSTPAESETLAAGTLTTNATPSSLLDTDTTNGLQLSIDSCSTTWTESGPPYSYTCPGATATVLASRPVIGTDMPLQNLGSVTPGATDHLRVPPSGSCAAPAHVGRGGEDLSASRAGRRPSPDRRRGRPAPPRSAAAGCTSPRGRSALAHLS